MGRLDEIARFLTLNPRSLNAPQDIRSTDRPISPGSNDFVDYRSIDSPAYNTTYSQSLAHAIDPEIVRDAYVKVATAYACIRLIGNAVAEAPIAVYRRRERIAEEIPNHRIRELLDEPNPEQSGPEFLYSVTTIAAVCGYCLLEHTRDSIGRTAELYPRNPARWTRKERINGTYYWEVKNQRGQIREVRTEDVTVVPYEPHPKLSGYGISPLKVIEREAGIENALTAWIAAFLERGAIIPHVLYTDQPIYDQAHVARMQIQWQQYQAGGAIDKPPVLTGGLKVQSVGGSVDDMAWPDLRGVTELKICQAFNVQPHLVGAKEAIQNGGLSTTELGEAQEYLQRYTIGPFRIRLAGSLTRGVLRPEQPDRAFFLSADTSKVLALQEERNKKHERARNDLQATGITVDEFRQETGRDPLPNDYGQVRLVPFSIVEQPIDEPPAPRDTPAAPAATSSGADPGEARHQPAPFRARYRDLRSLSKADYDRRAATIATARKRQAALARTVKPKLARFFRDQGKRLVPQIVEGFQPAAATLSATAAATKAVEDIDWQQEDDLLQRLLRAHYELVAGAAIEDINSLLGTELIWNVANPDIMAIWESLGLRITGITETTRLDVAKTVAKALEDGYTIEQLTEDLYGRFEETYKNRSETIARTESQFAYNTASALGFRQTGQVDECELHDNPDHNTEPGSDGLTCADRDGLIVDLVNVHKHIAGEHPNGSMAVSPIVRESDSA